MGIEEIHYRIYLLCYKANHLGKKLLLPELLDSMVYEMDMQDLQKSTAELSKR